MNANEYKLMQMLIKAFLRIKPYKIMNSKVLSKSENNLKKKL